jgi:hypothetical protein
VQPDIRGGRKEDTMKAPDTIGGTLEKIISVNPSGTEDKSASIEFGFAEV